MFFVCLVIFVYFVISLQLIATHAFVPKSHQPPALASGMMRGIITLLALVLTVI